MAPSQHKTPPDGETPDALKPKPKKASGGRLTLLDNGLVSMEKTPEHLVKVVKRNAEKSPLLRLPAEIRRTIWEFAVTGDVVQVSDYLYKATLEPSLARNFYVRSSLERTKEVDAIAGRLTAFHLSGTCRQIYAETATLPYARNIFSLQNSVNMCVKYWALRLVAAQRNSITDIKISVWDLVYISENMISEHALAHSFPSLKRVHIVGISSDSAREEERMHSARDKLERTENRALSFIFYPKGTQL